MFAFQSESILNSCVNVKELFARNRCDIWSLSDCNGTRTHNHLVCKRTPNHLAKLASLAKWLTACLRTKWLWVHIKCNEINTWTYNVLKNENASWSCIECSKGVFPFPKLHNTNFFITIKGKNLKFMTIRKKRNTQKGILIDRINEALITSDL